jgi:hypothetical protein
VRTRRQTKNILGKESFQERMQDSKIMQGNEKTCSKNDNNTALLWQEMLYGSAPAGAQKSSEMKKNTVKSFRYARPLARRESNEQKQK